MIQDLKKYLSIEGDTCKDLLGTNTEVIKFSQFWEENSENIGLIIAISLFNYTQSGNRSSEEVATFKEGLLALSGFFQKAYNETEGRKDIDNEESL